MSWNSMFGETHVLITDSTSLEMLNWIKSKELSPKYITKLLKAKNKKSSNYPERNDKEILYISSNPPPPKKEPWPKSHISYKN